MTETLLVIIIALLAANLLFVGAYIVLVLKEVRSAVMKMNEILDNISAISSAVANPLTGASGTLSAIVEGIKAVNQLRSLRQKTTEEEEIPAPTKTHE